MSLIEIFVSAKENAYEIAEKKNFIMHWISEENFYIIKFLWPLSFDSKDAKKNFKPSRVEFTADTKNFDQRHTLSSFREIIYLDLASKDVPIAQDVSSMSSDRDD